MENLIKFSSTLDSYMFTFRSLILLELIPAYGIRNIINLMFAQMANKLYKVQFKSNFTS